MNKKRNIKKKLLSMLLLLVTLLGTVQPIFAASGSSSFIAAQFASYQFTTDNAHTDYGIIIRKIYDRSTGVWKTVFCSEHGIDIATGERHNGTYSTPTDETLKYACKIAYFGWYEKYGDYVVDGGISVDRKKQFALVQQFIWESLGQSNATFTNASTQSEYVALKKEITNKINRMQTKPSFSGNTVTIDAGSSITLTDSNGVLTDYTSMDKTVDGIRLQHNKGENTMMITVSDDCTKENYRISDAMMKQWGCLKDGTQDYDTTFYLDFPTGVQDQIYSLNYNDPVTMSLQLQINAFGKLELSKLNEDGDLIDGAVFRIEGDNYSKDVTVTNGKIVVDKLKKRFLHYKRIVSTDRFLIKYRNI